MQNTENKGRTIKQTELVKIELSQLALEYEKIVRKVLHNKAYDLSDEQVRGKLVGAKLSGMLESFKEGKSFTDIGKIPYDKQDNYQRYRIHSQKQLVNHILEEVAKEGVSTVKMEAYLIFLQDLQLELKELGGYRNWLDADKQGRIPSDLKIEASDKLFYLITFFQENYRNLVFIDEYFKGIKEFEGLDEEAIAEKLTKRGTYDMGEDYLSDGDMLPIYVLTKNSIQPYKEREIDPFDTKEVYRNLHKDGFSIKQSSKVVAHGTNFIATDVSFKVSEAGRQRVLERKQKSVHASLLVDHIEPMTILPFDLSGNDIEEDLGKYYDEVYYNPYKHDTFINKRTGEKLTEEIDAVYFAKGRVFIIPHPEYFITEEYGKL